MKRSRLVRLCVWCVCVTVSGCRESAWLEHLPSLSAVLSFLLLFYFAYMAIPDCQRYFKGGPSALEQHSTVNCLIQSCRFVCTYTAGSILEISDGMIYKLNAAAFCAE